MCIIFFTDAWLEIIEHKHVCPKFCVICTLSINAPKSSDVNIFSFPCYFLNQREDGVPKPMFSKKIIFIMVMHF